MQPNRSPEGIVEEGYYYGFFFLGFVLLRGLYGYRWSGIRSAGMCRNTKERLAGDIPSHRSRVANVQGALGKGNFDIGFAQGFEQAHGDITLELKPIFLISPEANLEIQCAVAKAQKVGFRLRAIDDGRMADGKFKQQGNHPLRIRAIRDAEGDVHSAAK